ncbi:STAS domain-containing protein [Flavivirga abyssicola]|uniref:STAS domain-containing protein n=1 Tax=Flavivirga abyssicola TaxID=3063533 RepID=UPI0026E0DE23|nr:STAS domain-containing protein [Flavivirga sp. MEBiC07777]WVK13253.1 STAS domain-containing protein [Flavivirga sp. MEBiC07777]
MNFKIINNRGVFEIHGDFINEHTNQVATYFNNLLDTYYEVVICLNQVKRMDDTALNVMQFIAAKAKRRSKTLFVLGKENKRINKQFKTSNLNNIFKNDYDSK